MLFDKITLLVVGLGTLLAFFFWAWYITKREKKPLGEIVSVMLVHQRESIFVCLILIIYLAESLLASSVHPDAGELPSPLARFLSHFSVSIFGMVSSLAFIRETASLFDPELYKKPYDYASIIARSIVAGFAFLFAWAVPFANAWIISVGLGDSENIKYMLWLEKYVIFWHSHADYVTEVIKYGGDPISYRPMGAMSYQMQTTVILTLVHIFATISEGAQNLTSRSRRQWLFANPHLSEKDIEDQKKRQERAAAKEKGPTPEEKQRLDTVEEGIEYLLKRFKYSGDDLKKASALAKTNLHEKVESRDPNLAIGLASEIAKLRVLYEAADKVSDAKAKEDKKKDLDQQTRQLFAKSPKGATIKDVGLGITLSGSKGK